jgi:hypothetical protein
MTEAEQREVKALIEKTVAESAKVAAELEAKVAQLRTEMERKNKTLEGFIAENEALKSELGSSAGPVPVASTPFRGDVAETVAALCAGCYRWRLCFAWLTGITASGFLAAKLYTRPDTLRMLARTMTGRAEAAYLVLAALSILSAAAPALAVAGHWKWKQFKGGAPGVLRATAKVWLAIKEAFKSDE